MFRVNDIVVFKNATKYGSKEFKVLEVDIRGEVYLDNYQWYADDLIVLC